MKGDGYDVPDNLHYNKEHEWITDGKQRTPKDKADKKRD
jgi:glycine cleavage system H lipoate-binding protein